MLITGILNTRIYTQLKSKNKNKKIIPQDYSISVEVRDSTEHTKIRRLRRK